MTRRYVIGLGSNVDPHRNMAAAVQALVSRFGSLELSRVIETAPVGPMRGPFLNAVALFPSEMPPPELKTLLCGMEAALGRDRSLPDRATRDRTIDLDILLSLSPRSASVDAGLIPDEPYYRPLVLELVHMAGLACPVPAPGTEGATALVFGAHRIGLEPARLAAGRPGSPAAARPRRAAIVTGGAVRIGREVARTLAQAGYDIALHYNASEQEAARTAADCEADGVRCALFHADFRDAGCLPALVDAVADRFPHLELLVNSASVYESGSIAETTAELLDRQWSVNFKAPFLMMKEFRRRVARGTIINVLDNKIAFNQFRYAAYLSAKKALAEATKMAALEFAPRIRVNGLAPGVVMPAAVRDEAYLQWRRSGIPSGRLGNPSELCAALTMLAGNAFINGQILFVDGGESAGFVGRNAPEFEEARTPGTASLAIAAE